MRSMCGLGPSGGGAPPFGGRGGEFGGGIVTTAGRSGGGAEGNCAIRTCRSLVFDRPTTTRAGGAVSPVFGFGAGTSGGGAQLVRPPIASIASHLTLSVRIAKPHSQLKGTAQL